MPSTSVRTTALVCLAVASATPLLANTYRVTIPGSAFAVEGRPPVDVADVADGRQFHARQNFTKMILRAGLPLPPANAAEPKLQRLVVRFRTSSSGPSLRAVELRTPSVAPLETNIGGNYMTREVTDQGRANAWDWGRDPLSVGSQSVIRLTVQFPGGFDSQINPGEFVLASVTAEYVGKALSRSDVIGGVADRGNLDRVSRAGTTAPPPTIAPTPAPPERVRPTPKGVIYATDQSFNLLWYRHDGRRRG